MYVCMYVWQKRFPEAQTALVKSRALSIISAHMCSANALVRRWVCLCLCNIWTHCPSAKALTYHTHIHSKVTALLSDDVVEVCVCVCMCVCVRALCVYVCLSVHVRW